LELVYKNEPRKILDRFFLNSSSAKGARNRLRILQEELHKCIEHRSISSNPIRVVSFGSGVGHEVLGCIERFRYDGCVKAVCVDKDTNALRQGRLLAAQKGMGEYINYVQGNVLRMKPDNTVYDIGILSGLIDYFDFETAVSVLKMARGQLLEGGTILIANMRRHYLASTMSVLGNWALVYREPEEVEAILRESGYENINVWLEPEEVFCIGKARKPN
jgi:ubiquinone/menaquinone biosynthesis C-methylase UbiE